MNNQRTKVLARVIGIAILASSGMPSLAQAYALSDIRRETVRFDELNLSSPAGVQALYLRIRNAAGDVCAPEIIIGARVPSVAWKNCVGTAVREAILKVNHPSLTRFYTKRLRATAFRATG